MERFIVTKIGGDLPRLKKDSEMTIGGNNCFNSLRQLLIKIEIEKR